MSAALRTGALFSRRALLRSAFAAPALALAGCDLSGSGGVATVTIDPARIVADGRAIIAALHAALAIPAVALALGPDETVAEAALVAAGIALDQIAALSGGTPMRLDIDTRHIQALAMSLLADAQTALAVLQRRTAGKTAAQDRVTLLLSAAATLVPSVQQAACLATVMPHAVPMSEADALRIAGGA